MIDLELLRKNPEVVKEEIKKRGIKLDVNTDIELEKERRNLIFRGDELRSKKNDASKMIPKLKGAEKEKIIVGATLMNTISKPNKSLHLTRRYASLR